MARSIALEPTAHFFEPREYFDPDELVRLVDGLLLTHRCHPKLDAEGAQLRRRGASKLLRGFGITPTTWVDDPEADEPGSAFYAPHQTYDPNRLMREASELLVERELRPMDGMHEGSVLRLIGASMLLRGFGILPGVATQDHIDRDRHGQDWW